MGTRLKDKVAVVTGAGRGIGRAEAIALAAEGAKVVVNNRTAERGGTPSPTPVADEVVAEITKAGGIAVANYNTVADSEEAKQIIQTAVDKFGRLDILVNNAGILVDAQTYKVTDEQWDTIIKVDLYGVFYTCRAAAAIMREQRWGRIINTSSQAGAWGRFGQGNYAAAKEGIVGLTRVIARELGPRGITCNAIRPRATTRVALNPATLAAWEKEGRFDYIEAAKSMYPEHVAAFVTYLATEEASNINGYTFVAGTDGIGLYREPEPPFKMIYSREGWTLDSLLKVMPKTLAEGLVNPAPPKAA